MKENATRKLKQLFVIGIMLCAFNSAHAQTNYVLNGSFEYVTTCPNTMTNSGVSPNTFDPNKYPDDWKKPTNGSADLISNCYNAYNPATNPNGPYVWTLDNIGGCQNPQEGQNYMGFAASGASIHGGPFREMLQCTLSTAVAPNGLVAGQCYTLEFWVSLADLSERATPIHVNFSGGSAAPTQYATSPGYFGTMNLVPNLITPTVTNTTGWDHIVMPYTALGGEKYMTIGFFEDESSPNIITVTPNSSSCSSISNPRVSDYAYYYIDNVSLFISGGLFTPTSGYVFSNTTLNNINWSNSNVLLDGNITLTGTSSQITNCTVHCTKNCKITIPNGAIVDISSSTFRTGCDHMWNGFLVQSGGELRINTNSVIEDAVIAIDIDGGKWQIENTTFNKNAGDIRMSNINIPSSTYYIKGVQFDHTQLIKEPLLTPTGKGVYGIQVVSSSNTSAFPIKVGGSNVADVCGFIEGDYGIQSTNANMDVERCAFTRVRLVGIDFQGNNPTVKRSLTVTASSIVNSKRCILSQHKTNLIVKSSFFGYALEHAIEWDDNHDCDLLIGDETYLANGNTFLNNAWTCVTAWDNKSSIASATTMANDNTGAYTSIIIANNTMTAPYAAGGLLIGEWTLGQQVSYQKLNITANTFNNVTKGIQLHNVKGYRDAFGNNIPTSVPDNDVYGNILYTSTAASAQAFGIKVANAPGFNISENGVASDDNGNWQNAGIIFDNARNTEVYGNIINAGTGISLGNDLLGSNVHCNWLGTYAVGFALNSAFLRSGSTDLHGSAGETFNNTVSYTAISWNKDISLNFSSQNLNQWVWNNAATNLTIDYTNATGSGSLISSTSGTNACLGPFGISTISTNVDMSLADAPAQWLADYNYEVRRLVTDSGSSSVASANIKAIIGIEDNISAGNFIAANTALTALTPANTVESNYKKVLIIFSAIQYPSKRQPTTAEFDTLAAIAAQYTRIAGQSVTLARAFLAVKYNIYFDDEVFLMNEAAHGKAAIVSPCSLAPVSGTQLSFMDSSGNDLPIYATIDANGNFAFDPYHYQELSNTYGGEYRLFAKHGSTFTVVSQEFKKLSNWRAESPIFLELAGAAVAIDTVTDYNYLSIDNFTSIDDKNGHVYSIDTIEVNGNMDFLIQKYTTGNVLIWSRTFDGPASGDDTATCVTFYDGYIYVAGKVYNGQSYDYQVLKYDEDGVLIWTAYIADSLKKNSTPTGIMVDEVDYSVNVTGICTTDTTSEYHYVKLWECIPKAERLASPSQEEQSTATSSIDLYPNPSDGKITIKLNEQALGMLELYTLSGQLVFTQQLTHSGEVILPAEKVSNGVYLLKFTGAGNPEFKKLVIQRN